jgi:Fungal protein kinase
VRYPNVGILLWCSPAMTHSLDAGHRWLFEHADILHRDTSLDNLILRPTKVGRGSAELEMDLGVPE